MLLATIVIEAMSLSDRVRFIIFQAHDLRTPEAL